MTVECRAADDSGIIYQLHVALLNAFAVRRWIAVSPWFGTFRAASIYILIAGGAGPAIVALGGALVPILGEAHCMIIGYSGRIGISQMHFQTSQSVGLSDLVRKWCVLDARMLESSRFSWRWRSPPAP